MFSQTAPPWDFNGTDENFVGSNYSSVTAGDSYATYTITSPNDDGNGGSANPNMKNTDAMIDTSVGNFIALTIKNTTGNTRVQVITTTNGSNSFTNFDGISANDADFVTHYINMSSNGNWNGTLGTINFRFKQGGGVNNNVYSGDILFDNIEIVESIPATARIDYTFDDTSDAEGFISANGVTMSQPVAGELHLDIADQSPYPKLEQSGLYSVDADAYKYVQVTLVNNSPKNKLTFVSPSGGNEFSTTDITTNSSEAQTVEVDLSAFTNWSGTQSSWWFQLVENAGDGATASAGEMDIQQILFASESINPTTNALMLQGIMDFTVPEGGSAGKAAHLYANEDIADLSVYSVQMYSNGGTTASATTQLPALAVTAGQHILIARDVEAMEAYLNASVTFDHVIDGGSFPSGNGDDVVELVMDGSGIEAYGVIGVDGDNEAWNADGYFDYTDTWAYKVDGAWTAAPQDSSDGSTTTCDASEPYPAVDCTNWPVTSDCSFTLQLRDTYGDTWNGNTIDLLVNDVIVGNYTVDSSGTDFVSVATAEVSFGDVVSVSYNYSGSYPGENQWQMVDADGAVVSSGNYYDGNGDPVTCTDPTAINLAASATTDGGSATFTFDIANFTVGEAGSGADGHIHYSLNGGSTVMIYSSDALTLSDLPNGDHTIVFSLVDESHQPLDPAVEATVEFSTFDGTAECDETVTYTQVANGDYTVSVTAPEGQAASVTVNATMENGWDFLYVTDGAGNALNADQTTGSFADATYTSTDGTISVNVTNDGSVQNGDVTLAFTCAVPQTAVTFTVNTANIEVGENGMYVGGGVLGNALAYAMTDDDADGTYEVTVNLDQGTTGNYIFLNSPANGDDYGAKEVLDGQECADPNNWNDRILPEITGDAMTLQHCFGSCETDGTCPVPPVTSNVTFSVDTANYPGGLGESDVVYLNGNFNGWCGDCNPMSDDDGDGIWTITMELADGDYEYKFTVNGWNSQEEFSEVVEGCTISDGTYTNRALTVAGEDMVLPTVYWNLCAGETPGEVYNVTFNLDATGIEVGANGMYMGGGILGGANAVAMSDDDGDGVWTVTIEISTDQIGGNYTFLNSPNDGGDWGAKEDISGQECADADNYNDRIVPEFSGDAEFCYVFAVCTDGVCAEEPVTFPICEDFEGEDGAAGWTFIDAGGATSDWLLDTPANTGDQSIGHGYLPSDVAYNDWAVSPSYNTSGLAEGTATVSYYEYLNWSADAQAHNVYYTLDYAGDATTATWVLLTDVIGTDAEDVFVQRTFNIPSAESVVIGFQYLNTYGADWNIDDVCVDGTLSTTDTEILDMRIYPNPVNGNYVTIQSPIQGLKEVEVYTVTGRKVLQTVLTDDRLDVSSFNSGFYMVKVTINGQSKLSKLVVR
jgi:hypothetical protein